MARQRKTAASPSLPARQRLLAAATDLFAQKGYAATTVREIVAAAKVTKPVLYYYFRNKEGIYLSLMRETYGKLDNFLDTFLAEGGTATQKLFRFCDAVFSLFVENLRAVRVMYSIYYGPPQGAPFFDFDAYHLKFQDALRRLVEEGVRKKELRNAPIEDMVWALLGAISVTIEVQLIHPEMAIGREGLSRLMNLILEGIGKVEKMEKRNE